MTELTIPKLKRLYPRFCGDITFPDFDLNTVTKRSDVWVAKIMEDAYDEAMVDCGKSNLPTRLIKKGGIDLGSMDAFPLVVRRLLQQKFSVLEVMQRISLEFLVALHQYIDREIVVHHEDIRHPTSHCVNSKRATLFAKFLSEEFDLQYLALFLHCREASQVHFNIRYSNLVSPRVWMDLTTDEQPNSIMPPPPPMMATAGRSKKIDKLEQRKGAKPGKEETIKGTPHKLPNHLSYMQDTAIPEVQLVSFEYSLLPLLFQSMVPSFMLVNRIYFADRIVESAAKMIFSVEGQLNDKPVPVYFNVRRAADIAKETVKVVDLSPSLPLATSDTEGDEEGEFIPDKIPDSNVYGLQEIPIYALFWAMMEEWKKVPTSAKDNFIGRDETTEQLRVLNVIYDKDNLMLKELAESIRLAGIDLTQADAKLMKLEKAKRRLERKWNDNQCSVEEMDELTSLRVAVTEAKVTRVGFEEKVRNLVGQEKTLKDKVKSLWTSVTATVSAVDPSEAAGVSKGKKGKKKKFAEFTATGAPVAPWQLWRIEIMKQFESALVYNQEDQRLRAGLPRKAKRPKKILKSQSMSKLPVEEPVVEKVEVKPSPKKRPARPKPKKVHPTLPSEEEKQHATYIASLAEKEAHARRLQAARLLAENVVAAVIISSVADISDAILVKRLAQGLYDLPAAEEKTIAQDELAFEKGMEQYKRQQEELRRLAEIENLEASRLQSKQEELRALEAAIEEDNLALKLKEEASKRLAVEILEEEEEFRAIFEEARRLSALAEEEAALLRAKELEIQRLQALADVEASAAHDKLLEAEILQDIADVDHMELDTKESELGEYEERAIALAIHLKEKEEEVKRLQEISEEPESARWLSEEEAHKLQLVAEAEAKALEIERQENERLLAVALQEAEELRMKELEAQRLHAIAEAELLALRAKEEEIEHQRIAAEEEARLLLEQELEAERLQALAEAEAAEVHAKSLEAERQRAIAEAEAAEIRAREEEFEKARLVALEEARILREKELEAERQHEAARVEAEEQSHWHEKLESMTTSAALFVQELVVHDLLSTAVATQIDDPWNKIDIDPSIWLSPNVLDNVEHCASKVLHQRSNRVKKGFFKKMLQGLLLKRIRLLAQRRIQQSILESWKSKILRKRIVVEKIQVIQRFGRNIIGRRNRAFVRSVNIRGKIFFENKLRHKALDYLQYWRYLTRAEKKGRDVVFCLKDRRFIITFYTWLMVFKKHRAERLALHDKRVAATIVVQSIARMYFAKNDIKKIYAQQRIVAAIRVILAKRKVAKRRLKSRAIADYELSLRSTVLNKIRRKLWKRWRIIRNIGRGCRIAQATLDYSDVRFRMKVWKLHMMHKVTQRKEAAIKIQALARLYIVKKVVFDYYKWRRGLIKAQSLVRKKIMMNSFAITHYIFRSARRIQRLYRGAKTRVKLTESRIIAMHYAAAHNNYDRLLYFVNKYPEIVHELDEFGNTALHNAAANASRRTLKLLLRCDLNPNAVSSSGYSPLHLVIMSSAINRDDCCLYMLDHGFDEDQLTADGKTCLLLACEYGRTLIAKQLLQMGMNPNTPDNNGSTCLQMACANGHLPIVRELIDRDAYVNAPGYCGTVPLHDCIAAGDVEFPKLLLAHGAYLNVTEPYQLQTPLMWACSAGLEDVVRLYLLQGADSTCVDTQGRSCAHHAAIGNNPAVYFALHEADVDFELKDNDGNTPLHLATEYNSYQFVQVLLHALVYPSSQNNAGDQPSHIAAKYNFFEVLALLCKYDTHIGRVNLSHQTPLGVAKYYGAREAVEFLESRFTKVELGRRNEEGGRIWWDKPIDEVYEDWHVRVSDLGVRTFIHKRTGEIRSKPPVVALEDVMAANEVNEINLRKNVEIVREGGYSLTKHDYLIEHQKETAELHHYLLQIKSVTVINKYTRRKLAYMRVARIKKWKKKTRIIGRFVKHNLPRFKARMHMKKMLAVIKPQAIWRGIYLRKKFYDPVNGDYQKLVLRRYALYFKQKLWKMWKRFKFERIQRIARILQHMPQTSHEWQLVVWRAKHPTRVVGMYEEFLFPGAKRIFFYRHKTKHTCTFQKPEGFVKHDEQRRLEAEQIRLFGFTPQQRALAVKLQALWRGYKVRSYFYFIEKAMVVYLRAEENYMSNPNDELNLYNYALYCHAVLHDIPHARELYSKAIQKMEIRGPDIPFILYAYAIFAFVTHDQDYADICALLDRARNAELYQADVEKRKLHDTSNGTNVVQVKRADFKFGSVFQLASVGFFRFTANQRRDAMSWHNLAACLFLVYNDFEGSFDSFLNAFRYDPNERRQKSNFDAMMAHFFGNDKELCVEIVKERMQKLAARDAEIDNFIRKKAEDEVKNKATIQIQRIIRGFIHRVRVQNLWVQQLQKKNNVNGDAKGGGRGASIASSRSGDYSTSGYGSQYRLGSQLS